MILHTLRRNIDKNMVQQFKQYLKANLFVTNNGRLKQFQNYEKKNINLI